MNGASEFSGGDALELAKRGVAVFPCGDDKRPLVAGGFKAATTDPATVTNWWNRWPRALIGVPTGRATGLDAVDLDIDRDTGEAIGEASLRSAGFDLSRHPHAVRTRSGGAHLLFATGDLRTTAGALRGVDVRSCGGYVIAWSPGAILDAAADPALAAPPAALADLLRRRGKADGATGDPGPTFDAGPRPAGGGGRWAQAALDREIAAVRSAPQGTRNATLNRAAFALAQIAAGGGLDAARVQADLMAAALAAGLSEGEARATVRSGMDAGAQEPRTRPERDPGRADAGRSDPGRADPCGASTASTGGADAGQSAGDPAPDRGRLFFTASTLAGRPIPARPWHVGDLIPGATVTLLGGDGGTGKSLLALQLAVATATGGRWIGRDVTAGPALYLSAEDDADELHRRLADIARGEGLDLADLDRLSVASLAGEDALLALFDPKTGAIGATPLFADLEDRVAAARPALIVLDTLADLHAGNENDRAHARQFVGLLRGLAIRNGCAVLLLAHPSRAGMEKGDGLSGSTAWNGSVRSRLYLDRVKDDGFEADPNRRSLRTMKANYGPAGGDLMLTWRAGVFVADAPEPASSGLDRMADSAKGERVFMKLLRTLTEQGRHVSPTPSVTYAPAVFAKHPDAEGMTKRALAAAMEKLLSAGRIVVAHHGRGESKRAHLTFPEAVTP